MGTDIKFKKTRYCFDALIVAIVIFTSIYQQVNAICSIDAKQSDEKFRYERLCHIKEREFVLVMEDGYEWEPSSYIAYECVKEPDTGYFTRESSMCNVVGFRCEDVQKPIPFYKRKKVDSSWERVVKNVTNCECVMPIYY